MAPQYRPPHCSPCDSGERERGCPGDFQLCSRARGLLALRHPRGQRTDAARARILWIPRVRHDHGSQRHAAHRLRLDERGTTRQHLTAVTRSRPQMRPTLSHAIPCRHRLTMPQKPHDFNVSVSKSEILVGNCMRLLWSCTRYGALHPISGHYTRSERVQCSLIGCTASSATSSIADAFPRWNGRHD